MMKKLLPLGALAIIIAISGAVVFHRSAPQSDSQFGVSIVPGGDVSASQQKNAFNVITTTTINIGAPSTTNVGSIGTIDKVFQTGYFNNLNVNGTCTGCGAGGGGTGRFSGGNIVQVTDGITTSTLTANSLYIATSSANNLGLFNVDSSGNVNSSGTVTTSQLAVIGPPTKGWNARIGNGAQVAGIIPNATNNGLFVNNNGNSVILVRDSSNVEAMILAAIPNVQIGSLTNNALQFMVNNAVQASFSNSGVYSTVAGVQSSFTSSTANGGIYTVSTTGNVYMTNLPQAVTPDNIVCRETAGLNSGLLTDNNSATTCSVSSRLVKHDIVPLTDAEGLSEVLAMNPVSFKRNSDNKAQVGFIAEEMLKVEPRVVFLEKDEKTPRGIDYSFLTANLTKAIQELKKIIDIVISDVNKLTHRVDYQQQEIDQLKSEIKKLQTKV